MDGHEEVALLLFPAEVWDVILGNLDHSVDILNVFKSYPELHREVILRNKRHLWLFEHIFPHIIPWLSRRGLLSCRQVCWMWRLGMDNFLENHPTKRAHSHKAHHELIIPGQQQWIPETSPRHYKLEKHFSGWKPIKRMEVLSELIERFPTPPERNPIVGRSVTFINHEADHMDDFWKGVVELLKHLGPHIWYVQFRFGRLQGTLRLCRVLLDMLGNLPNLKSLQIDHATDDFDDEEEDDKNDALQRFIQLCRDAYLPPLPCLETLVIECFPKSLADMLVLRYSTQLRKLDLDHRYWKPGYSELLQNLTEFKMAERRNVHITDCDFLVNLKAHNLYRLEFSLTRADDRAAYMERIIPELDRFPKLGDVKILFISRPRPPQSVGSSEPLPGPKTRTSPIISDLVKTLAISSRPEELNQFLLQFPSIKHIEIRTTSYLVKKEDLKDAMYRDNIWGSYPKLRKITIIVQPPPRQSRRVGFGGRRRVIRPKEENITFTREAYEYLNKQLTA